MTARLGAATWPTPRPERTGIVHLGLGAFHRSHQVWYTARADAAGEWGVEAFTGRSPSAAAVLTEQDGLYSLIERSQTDEIGVVGHLLAAHDGRDAATWARLMADPAVAVLTITVTESGYRLAPSGEPLWSDTEVLEDVERLSRGDGLGLGTPVGRIVAGLAERRRRTGRAMSVVPCDNVPANGDWLRRGVLAFAERVDPQLAGWIADEIDFVRTSVDRITPAATGADRADVESRLHVVDLAPVVAEPAASWILSGRFPAGRPAWETAGARFVTDIGPFEQRKLLLLNGAHTTLALVGPRFGATTVADAIRIPAVRALVERFWDAAERQLPAEVDAAGYREALLVRFENGAIRHLLAQIGTDGSRKLQVRVVPVARAERAAGRDADAPAIVLAAWIAAAIDGVVQDAAEAEIRVAAAEREPVIGLLRLLDADLADDAGFVRLIRRHLADAGRPRAPGSTRRP